MPTRDFLLPDLGEGLTEGEVVSWLVAVGDTVAVDQYVAEVETAKAVVEVPSPYAGTVTALHAQPGEEVEVGAPLLTIEVEDPAAGPPEEPTPTTPVEDDVVVVEEGGEADDESGNVLVGYGTAGGKGSRRRRVTAGSAAAEPAQAPAPPAEPVARDTTPPAKPPVRKMAKDLGVDLTTVRGSGPDGIITRADVEAAAGAATRNGDVAAPGQPEAAQPAHEVPAAPAPEPVAIPTAPAGGRAQQRVPMTQIRKAISAQMSRSRREIPEAVTWVEADATPLWELRQRLNDGQGDVKVSALAIIMRMAVAGLRRYPTLNASLDTTTEEMVLHGHVHMGFAAQTDRGLVVPVIEHAEDRSILELAGSLNELAETARAGKLQPDQMRGGTFTISNYGAFGVDGGDMVINHPESAILGTGRIVDKPWVVDGRLAVRKVITYSIAFDHRLVDGGEAAGFLRLMADMTEDPTLLTASL